MNFTALKAELAARGFNHIGDPRLGQFINEARATLDGMFPWPYRYASTTGTAPLTIANLGVVDAVFSPTSEPLPIMDQREVWQLYTSAVPAGTPEVAYVISGTVYVAPTSTGTIGVNYYKVPPDLSSGTDVPLSPSQFHPLIVRMAQQLAYIDTDNTGAAAALQPWVDQGVQQMVAQLIDPQLVGPSQHVLIGDGSCDS